MAKLIYSMIQSLDGYTEDERGDFSWGRYKTMVFWETAHTLPDKLPFFLEYARLWQAANSR